jgi:hypothetical protein
MMDKKKSRRCITFALITNELIRRFKLSSSSIL